MQEYISSYQERGRAEGRMEGRMESKREDLLQFLAARFNFDPRKVEEQISGLQDLEALNRLLLRLYAAQSSEEAQGLLREAPNPPAS